MKSFFSVIIPVYNRQLLIKKAIQSVLSQTFSDFEIIVVDDCSTDNSSSEILSINDPRINLIQLKVNSGNAKARNEGWKKANGEWVVFLDSDDFFESAYLENLKNQIKENSTMSFFWSGVRYVDLNSNMIKEEMWSPNDSLPSYTFFDSLRIGTNCGVAFKRVLLEKHHGFDESFKAAVDREFFLRVSICDRGMLIPKVLVNCLIGDHPSVRKKFVDQAQAYNRFLEMYSKEIMSSLSRKRWWIHKTVWLNLYAGNTSLAYSFLKQGDIQIKSILMVCAFWILPRNVAIKLHKSLSK